MSHGHEKADARNLALHRLALEKLRANPEASRQKVLALIDRWMAMPHLNGQIPLLVQWRKMLELPSDFLTDKILADEGQQLRQCSPLGVLITPQERFAVYRELSAAAAGSVPNSPGDGSTRDESR